jgi:hypothetical protein
MSGRPGRPRLVVAVAVVVAVLVAPVVIAVIVAVVASIVSVAVDVSVAPIAIAVVVAGGDGHAQLRLIELHRKCKDHLPQGEIGGGAEKKLLCKHCGHPPVWARPRHVPCHGSVAVTPDDAVGARWHGAYGVTAKVCGPRWTQIG